MSMDKSEIQQIVDFLVDVRDGLCERDGDTTLHLHLTELHGAIRRLTDATFAAQNLQTLLTSLEHEVRLCKQKIKRRLGARN